MNKCERCNATDKPVRRRLVDKGGVVVTRHLCDDCAEVIGWTYPVRLAEPMEPTGTDTVTQEAPAARPKRQRRGRGKS